LNESGASPTFMVYLPGPECQRSVEWALARPDSLVVVPAELLSSTLDGDATHSFPVVPAARRAFFHCSAMGLMAFP